MLACVSILNDQTQLWTFETVYNSVIHKLYKSRPFRLSHCKHSINKPRDKNIQFLKILTRPTQSFNWVCGGILSICNGMLSLSLSLSLSFSHTHSLFPSWAFNIVCCAITDSLCTTTSIDVHAHTHTQTRTQTHPHTHTQLHTCRHTRTHTHTHAHTSANPLSLSVSLPLAAHMHTLAGS